MTDRQRVSGYSLALFVFLTIVVMAILSGWQTCSDQGGQYVRGVMWFTCVGEETP